MLCCVVCCVLFAAVCARVVVAVLCAAPRSLVRWLLQWLRRWSSRSWWSVLRSSHAPSCLRSRCWRVCCACCVRRAVGGMCSAPEASDSNMCVLKRASKDACGSAGIMSTATISITIVAKRRYASCTNSHLRRPIQPEGARAIIATL